MTGIIQRYNDDRMIKMYDFQTNSIMMLIELLRYVTYKQDCNVHKVDHINDFSIVVNKPMNCLNYSLSREYLECLTQMNV